jgi:4'-phosphopantetheinyl transferase EntD
VDDARASSQRDGAVLPEYDPDVETIALLPGVRVALLPYPDRIALELLTAGERRIFDGLTTDKRRREWWAGRMAARSALGALGLGERSILRDPQGRPVAEGAHVAITHGDTLAAAAASLERHVGIDVLDPHDQTRLERIASRVLSGPEPELAAAHPQDGLRLIWGTREAVAKATHTGMFAFALTKAHATAIDRETRRITTNRAGIDVSWVDLGGGELLVVASATDAAVALAQSECP